MKRVVAFISLFTSFSTLICCALPALFVVLGMGAAFAGLVSNVPQLIWISENKLWFFGFGAVMLGLGGALQWHSRRNLACPVDQKLGEACGETKDWSLRVYFASVGIYLVGAFFAFFAERLL